MKNTLKCLGLIACLSAAVSLVTMTSGCSGDRYSRSTGETMDDAAITAKVKSQFVGDLQVKALQVKVDTYRGEVQLTGFVDTPDQKQRAEQLARQVDGVQMVRNDIIVKTQEPAGAETPRKDNLQKDNDLQNNNNLK